MVLRQENTRICIPYVYSIKGYGLSWDNYSPTVFTDDSMGMSFDSEAGEGVDYYFMFGGNADDSVAQMRELTGDVPMNALWTYGFWQSRERYTSQEETVGVVRKFRELGVPLDGIIQDWQYWGTDVKDWNSIEFRNPKFGDPQKMVDEVHDSNAHIIISVWLSFGHDTNIFKELDEKGMLLDFITYPPETTRGYDAFNPEARDIFWDYMNRNIFSLGMDGWWLDATEPEFMTDDEKRNQSTHLGLFRKNYNAFPLLPVGSVYDNQRAVSDEKRVFILTRSAFAGQQRYGANSWSGDIESIWDDLFEQISAGVNFSIYGIPYWNTDIGGFFARNFSKGIRDATFHELYVRWTQFGAFTPMIRSHGTIIPREIYLFGKRGSWAFDAQENILA